MNLFARHRNAVVVAALATLMVLTRFHHFGSVTHLPDASWAIFLAGGYLLQRLGWFALFSGLAVVIDYLAITRFGVSGFCVSAAYGFLLPAYGALWFGGRWLGGRKPAGWRGLPVVAAVVVASVGAAFLISSGSFYWLSGRIGETSVAGFLAQSARYFPSYLAVTAGYVAAFVAIRYAFIALSRHQAGPRQRHV